MIAHDFGGLCTPAVTGQNTLFVSIYLLMTAANFSKLGAIYYALRLDHRMECSPALLQYLWQSEPSTMLIRPCNKVVSLKFVNSLYIVTISDMQ